MLEITDDTSYYLNITQIYLLDLPYALVLRLKMFLTFIGIESLSLIILG